MSRIEKISDEIWREELCYCDIPERLHDKIRAQIPTARYFKDGIFDAPAFRSAVEAEIREWDRTPHVLGAGFIANRDTFGRLIKGPKALEKEL